MAFEKEWKIYAGDTDYSGRIYTPVVVDYLIKTLQDFRASIGFPNERFESGEYIPPARNIDINYLSAIRTGDRVGITIDPTVGTTSITYDVVGEVDGKAVFDGTTTTVFIDKGSQEPIPVPEEFKRGVETAE
ncbi:MAG: thioesterase family protein [Halovenus sp.]